MTHSVSGRLLGGSAPRISGRIPIPASKSHTVRALLIAAFADGESRLRNPLISRDTHSCLAVVEALGASVSKDSSDWLIRGFGSRPPAVEARIDVGNSGTTLFLAAAMAALTEQRVHFDGDAQIRRRSAEPLLTALEDLGVQTHSSPGGVAPFSVQGPLKPGEITLKSPVSQYLSALLLVSPLIRAPRPGITTVNVAMLNEAPYVGITLDWLDMQGIRYQRKGWDQFRIPSGQSYRPFNRAAPSDWSSATFFLVAAAVTGGDLLLEGLDSADSQGDRAVVSMLEEMGCEIEETDEGIYIVGRPLSAVRLDLNATPDALPAMAVAACFARGESRLENVPQARMKETDRIAVMCAELRKLGADVEELPDGIIVRGRRPDDTASPLKGCRVDGHGDHRVVMALAVAALGAAGTVEIQGAEAADVTFPGFFTLLDRARAV